MVDFRLVGGPLDGFNGSTKELPPPGPYTRAIRFYLGVDTRVVPHSYIAHHQEPGKCPTFAVYVETKPGVFTWDKCLAPWMRSK